MTKKNDNFTRALRRIDPVEPGELEGAADSADAAELMERIMATGHEPAVEPRRVRRSWLPKLALTAAATAAVAVAVAVLVVGPSGGGAGKDQLTSVLGAAAATAGAQSPSPTDQPYTYLKTREVSVSTDAAESSTKVLQSTTREEWVTRDGAGRLKIVDDPSRVIGSGDGAEPEGAGGASLLSLELEGRTEDRFLDAGMLRGSVAELPTDPATLARRLRDKAEIEYAEMPVGAATLELIAEDLRDPGASPRLRRALYEAAKLVPGVEYLGEEDDPAGRRGVAVGITSSDSGAPVRYSLIFDPETSQVLATETTSLARPGAAAPHGPTLLRTRVYLKPRGIESMMGNGGTWLSGFDPSTSSSPGVPNLVYGIPDLGVS